VVGDHGEGLGEHHEDTHGIFLYDSTTHVPLLVKLPEQREAGRTVKAQVRTTDIMPSILEVLGVLLRRDGWRITGAIPYGTGAAPRTVFGWRRIIRCALDGLLCGPFERKASSFIEAPKPELLRSASDPNELQNHYVPWDPRVQKLRKILAELSAKSPPLATKSSPATVSGGHHR